MKARFSLHRTRVEQICGSCGVTIPVRKLPDYAEYWKVKGGDARATPRVLCCLCHALYDLPTDGWEDAPDGKESIAALVPQK